MWGYKDTFSTGYKNESAVYGVFLSGIHVFMSRIHLLCPGYMFVCRPGYIFLCPGYIFGIQRYKKYITMNYALMRQSPGMCEGAVTCVDELFRSAWRSWLCFTKMNTLLTIKNDQFFKHRLQAICHQIRWLSSIWHFSAIANFCVRRLVIMRSFEKKSRRNFKIKNYNLCTSVVL